MSEVEELTTQIKDLSLKVRAYQDKVSELNAIIDRQEKLIEELRAFIRN